MLSARARRMLEVLLTGLGSAIALALAGGGAGWAIPGAAAGLLCAFAVEGGLNVRLKLRWLTELEQEIEIHREREHLLEEQVRLARQAQAVSEAWTEVFGGVVSEAMTTGRVVPLEALMARAEMTLKARGLDVPVAPPTNPHSHRAEGRPIHVSVRPPRRCCCREMRFAPGFTSRQTAFPSAVGERQIMRTLRDQERSRGTVRHCRASTKQQQPRDELKSCVTVPFPLHALRGGAYEDLLERHALRPADGKGDDVGDVLCSDPDSAVASSAAFLLGFKTMVRDPLGPQSKTWSRPMSGAAPAEATGITHQRSQYDRPPPGASSSPLNNVSGAVDSLSRESLVERPRVRCCGASVLKEAAANGTGAGFYTRYPKRRCYATGPALPRAICPGALASSAPPPRRARR